MKTVKRAYKIDQCALYKCGSKTRLASVLKVHPDVLKRLPISYHSFPIDKKNDKKFRLITAPDWALKRMQSRILQLLQNVERPEWIISGTKGKSYIDNGKIHCQNDYVLTLDIAQFYDNCRREAAYRFYRDTMKTSPDVAGILADITTHSNRIPTGCPTSQLIAYYAYENMFEEIHCYALQHNLLFTLYVDDMTFSSATAFNYKTIVADINDILNRHGHRLKLEKVKYYTKKKTKLVTGVAILPDHRLAVPNALQEKIYDGFIGLTSHKKGETLSLDEMKAYQRLMGRINSARGIAPDRFPEMVRIANDIYRKATHI